MENLNKLCVCLMISLLVFFALPCNVPETHAENSPEVTSVLEFFEKVLMINVSDCDVTGFNMIGENNPELGIRNQVDGKLTLYPNGGGAVDALFIFTGEYIEWCLVYHDVNQTNPLPYLEEPSGDPLDMALKFIRRYETYTNDPIVTEMRVLLESVNSTEPMTKTAGNIKLIIEGREGKPDFYWRYTIENVDFNLLHVSFLNPPHIYTFSDQRYQLNLNSTAIPKYEPLVPETNDGSAYNSVSSAEFNLNPVLVASIFLGVALPILAVVVFSKRKHAVIRGNRLVAFVRSKHSSKQGFNSLRGGNHDE